MPRQAFQVNELSCSLHSRKDGSVVLGPVVRGVTRHACAHTFDKVLVPRQTPRCGFEHSIRQGPSAGTNERSPANGETDAYRQQQSRG